MSPAIAWPWSSSSSDASRLGHHDLPPEACRETINSQKRSNSGSFPTVFCSLHPRVRVACFRRIIIYCREPWSGTGEVWFRHVGYSTAIGQEASSLSGVLLDQPSSATTVSLRHTGANSHGIHGSFLLRTGLEPSDNADHRSSFMSSAHDMFLKRKQKRARERRGIASPLTALAVGNHLSNLQTSPGLQAESGTSHLPPLWLRSA